MYYSRYDNRQTIGVWALITITLIAFVVMLIPIYTDIANPLWVKLSATIFPLAGATVIAATASNMSIVKKNFILPAFYTIITMGAVGFSSGCWKGYMCATILFLAWYMTISMQHDERCVWKAFYLMAALSAGTLISGTMVVFVPFFFIGLAIFYRFNLTTISAALLGAGFVYALLYGTAYLFGDIVVINNYISTLYCPVKLPELSNYEVIAYSIIGLYTIIAFIAFLSRFNSNSISFRRTMLFNYIIMFVAIIMVILFPEKGMYESFVCLMCGVTLPFFTEFRKSKAIAIIFHSFTLTLFLLFCVKNFILTTFCLV